MKTPQELDNRERVLLVGVGLKKSPRGRMGDPTSAGRDSLEELTELAESAGAKIEGSLLQVRETLDPAALAGALGEQNLNGDRLAQHPIPGPIHRPAAPLPQRGLDLIAARQDGPRPDLERGRGLARRRSRRDRPLRWLDRAVVGESGRIVVFCHAAFPQPPHPLYTLAPCERS